MLGISDPQVEMKMAELVNHLRRRRLETIEQRRINLTAELKKRDQRVERSMTKNDLTARNQVWEELKNLNDAHRVNPRSVLAALLELADVEAVREQLAELTVKHMKKVGYQAYK